MVPDPRKFSTRADAVGHLIIRTNDGLDLVVAVPFLGLTSTLPRSFSRSSGVTYKYSKPLEGVVADPLERRRAV